MKLVGITFSGADNDTCVGEMSDLVEKPFFPTLMFSDGDDVIPKVEFGILYSRSRGGTRRYPDRKWINGLLDEYKGLAGISIHLCGEVAGYVAAGVSLPRYEYAMINTFDRMQINHLIQSKSQATDCINRLRNDCGFLGEVIFQLPHESHVPIFESIEDRKVSFLFDDSRGTGNQSPVPIPPDWMKRFGFAGGIGPGNMPGVLKAIDDTIPGDSTSVWIDMESSLCEPDGFDLKRAKLCYSQARSWVWACSRQS